MPDLDRHLAAIAAGDPEAFARWVAGAEPRLRDSLSSFAAALDVEAVLQESLLRVWQVVVRFRPDGKPNGLLRLTIRIARNLAVSELRARGRVVSEDDRELTRMIDGLAAGDLPEAPDPLLRRLIEACRRALPRQPRTALEARLQAGGAEPDTVLAARLRMRLNTFLQNVTRARKALAECLRRGGMDLEVLP
jgi:DNA-directed RNA polymerase specialized sigma24 family protein